MKFSKLYKKSSTQQLDTDRVIINLSSKVLDTPTKNALKKGFNFAIAPQKMPTENIICGIESAIQGLPEATAEEIRQDVSSLVRRAKPPQRNISKTEIAALKTLKEDTNITVLAADKGNATVLMNTLTYKSKMHDLLQDGTYSTIRNPTARIKTDINKLIQNSTIEEDEKKKLLSQDPKPPVLYGLPKIHKQGIPMRPIVSAIGSATHKIARYLSKVLQPTTGQTPSFVKNSSHLIEKLDSLKIEEGDILVSFDVVSLFTKIPIEEAIILIKNRLPEDLAKIAEYCLRSTYFLFDGKYYKQQDGSPMGSPISPVVANIFMEYFEDTALSTAKLRPKCWLRYVDDVFLIWQYGIEALSEFLNHMNSIHPNIQFTMELENSGSLPFLDVLVTRKEDGSLGHKVYRKPTHTDRYLNAESHHHPAQKSAVINSLVSRGIKICDNESWQEEKQHLRTALCKNGFKKGDINRAISRQISQRSETNRAQLTNLPERKAFLPYVKGTTDKISKILRRHNISTIFTTGKTTKSLLGTAKEQLPLKTSGVYEVPCSCGKSYIGMTGRLISTRVQEHIRAVKNNDHKSAVAEHSEKTGHLINFEKTKVLASVPRYHNRIVREAIEIEKHPNNFNREDGYRLSRTWKPLVSTLSLGDGVSSSANTTGLHNSDSSTQVSPCVIAPTQRVPDRSEGSPKPGPSNRMTHDYIIPSRSTPSSDITTQVPQNRYLLRPRKNK